MNKRLNVIRTAIAVITFAVTVAASMQPSTAASGSPEPRRVAVSGYSTAASGSPEPR